MQRMPRHAAIVAAICLVILFLASVARFYHPGTGFTSLIGFPEDDGSEAPVLATIPHHQYPAWASYDGQFYAQRAFDPLLRDPAVDRAMDLAPFRARRILFSWTAYVAGLGRPAWILEAYALQNVVCWLLLAALLTRWMPPTSGRGLALWGACLFSHGLLWSVRFSLLDGPSLLLIACAVRAIENGRPLLSAAVVGIAGLGRETNVIAGLAQPIPRDVRSWARLALAGALVALPLLIWMDYLWSIYRSTVFAGANQFVAPFGGLWDAWRRAIAETGVQGLVSGGGLALCLLFPLAVQVVYLAVRPEWTQPWWRVAAGYALLLLVLDRTLASPVTGAITRVMLPMTFGFNVLLASESRAIRFWPWYIAGNLLVMPAHLVMPLVG